MMDVASFQPSGDAIGVNQSLSETIERDRPTAQRSEQRTVPPRPDAKPGRLEKWLLQRLFKAAGNPPLIASLWNGEEVASASAALGNGIRFRIGDRRTLWKILVDPFFQFPEAYADGRLTVEADLEPLMNTVADA